MKQFFLPLTFLIGIFLSAQIPAGYYDNANGLTGYALKTALSNIITVGHSPKSYNDLYNGYVTTFTDNYYENDGTVLDFYSENPNGPDPYNYTHGSRKCGNYTSENDCYNREHLVPQSSFNEASPMKSDIHHVIPTDGYVNNRRGSYPFGKVGVVSYESANGSKVGSSSTPGYSGTVFEPIDEFKGDIARCLMYFAVRYEDQIDSFNFTMFNGTNDQVFTSWAIAMLLEWHTMDPVSQAEIDRNNAAYNFQGNANPFIDHPDYAQKIWGTSSDDEAPSDPTNLVASNPTDNTIDLTWTASTDNTYIDSYNIYIDDVYTFNSSTNSFTVTGLSADTNYCFTVQAKDTAGNLSGFSNQACETTTNNGTIGGGSEIFFSEYIEGGGYNKILEIANFTGSTVDLSNYTIKRANNGAGDWESTYNFPAGSSITNGDVYVVANPSTSICSSEYDDESETPTSYNGNDVVGLFKNDVLIDIIGELGNDSNFAKDVTLVRKENILQPNTTYTPNEWNEFNKDDCSHLGSHTVSNLGVIDELLPEFKIYPNPVKSNLFFQLSENEKALVEFYNATGQLILSREIKSSTGDINVQHLKPGIYFVKIIQGKNIQYKKIIKQ